MTLLNLLTGGCTLEQVSRFWNEGRITDHVYLVYCHIWQTSAPRFAIQACRCTPCLSNPV